MIFFFLCNHFPKTKADQSNGDWQTINLGCMNYVLHSAKLANSSFFVKSAFLIYTEGIIFKTQNQWKRSKRLLLLLSQF